MEAEDSGFISIASSAKLQYLLALKDLLNAVAMLRDGDGSFRADLKSRIKRVADSIEAELGLLENLKRRRSVSRSEPR
jgi:hypothetical protein